MAPVLPDQPQPVDLLGQLAWVLLVLSVIGALFIGVTMGYVEGEYSNEINPVGIAIAVAVLLQGALAFAVLRAAIVVLEDLRAARNSLARMEPKPELVQRQAMAPPPSSQPAERRARPDHDSGVGVLLLAGRNLVKSSLACGRRRAYSGRLTRDILQNARFAGAAGWIYWTNTTLRSYSDFYDST